MNINNGTLAACLVLTLSSAVQATELPEGFVDETFVGGIDGQITAFDMRDPERIFISEKAGIVRVIVDGVVLDEPFLDINEIVNDRVDRGMLSVAVHPQFPQQPFIYVLYTYDPPELVTNGFTSDAGVQDGNGNRVSRLVRYTADANRDFNVAVAGSETIILGRNSTYAAIGNAEDVFDTITPSCGPVGNPTVDCLPIDEITHTIGALRFGSDGSLYVTNGDGVNYRYADPLSQMTYDLDSLRGKILRIDADTGLGLPDNPYFDGDAASNRSRVLSYGLRNPYSLTLHPMTDEPYVGEVGWENHEELNGGRARNFGWPCYEGTSEGNLPQPDFATMDFCVSLYESSDVVTAPLDSWPHGDTGNAVVVGDFNFGEAFPEQYMGKLFYGDFIQGWLRYADVSDPDNVVVSEFATDMPPMVEMRAGDDGALYYASITTGEIRRIRFTGENQPDGDDFDPSVDTVTDASSGNDTDSSNGNNTDTATVDGTDQSGSDGTVDGTDLTGSDGTVETTSNPVSVGGMFSPLLTLLGGLLIIARRTGSVKRARRFSNSNLS